MTNEQKILDILSAMQGDVSSLKTDVSSLKTDVSSLKTDVAKQGADISSLKTDVSSLKNDVSSLKNDVSSLKNDVSSLKNDVLKINLKLENDIEPNIRLLAEGHAMIIERMSPKERMDELEEEVKFLKSVMRQMNEDIQQLKHAQ